MARRVLNALAAILWMLASADGFRACAIPGLYTAGSWYDTYRAGYALSRECAVVIVSIMTDAYDVLPTPVPAGVNMACRVIIVDPASFALFSDARELDASGALYYSARLEGFVVLERRMHFANNQCNARTVKALLHLFFPFAQYHVYADANYALQRSGGQAIVAGGLRRHDGPLVAIPRHPRGDVALEMDIVAKYNITPAELVEYQRALFAADAAVAPDEYHTDFLLQGNFRMQRNVDAVRAFGCLWFSFIMDYSHRDQLSLVKALTMTNITRASGRLNVMAPDTLARKTQEHDHPVRWWLEPDVVYPCRESATRNKKLAHPLAFPPKPIHIPYKLLP